MIIDCVFDDSMADELAQYLRKNGHAVTTENSIIITKDDAKKDLESFVIETDRSDYSICTFEDALILSRKMPAEEMGIRVCKQCGFLDHQKTRWSIIKILTDRAVGFTTTDNFSLELPKSCSSSLWLESRCFRFSHW